MIWSGNFKTAARSLRASRWRSLLTMLGIIIGISSVVTIVSLGEGLKHQIVGQVNSLGSNVLSIRSGKLVSSSASSVNLNLLAFLSASTLTAKDVQTVEKLPAVNQTVPIDFVTNAVKNDQAEMDNVYVVGTSPDLPNVLDQKLDYGGFFTPDNSGRAVAVIGSNIAHQLFGELNPVGQSLTINGRSFIVYGVLSQTSGGLFSVVQTDFNSAVFIPFQLAEDLNNGQTNILQILASVKPGFDIDTATSNIQSALTKNHGQQDFSVLKQTQLLNLANNAVNTATGFISAIAAISLLVGGIGIMDIMLVSVSERTREIGIRKAIGATNRQIRNQFLTEGIVLTLTGGLIGIVASLVIDEGLKLYTNWRPLLNWPILISAVGLSIVVGTIFSVAPAVKAARKDPIDALRG